MGVGLFFKLAKYLSSYLNINLQGVWDLASCWFGVLSFLQGRIVACFKWMRTLSHKLLDDVT